MVFKKFAQSFKLIVRTIILPPLILLSGCSNLPIVPEEPEEKPVSILTGKSGGTNIGYFMNKQNISGGGMPVNALLWRAALDISSFVPLDDVDTFGGSIVTEWYQPADNPDQRLKLTIFVLGVELRSDAVRVQTYTQKKLGNDWIDSGRDEALARRLEDLILTRARELRAESIFETTQ
jgi:hypothetical protein